MNIQDYLIEKGKDDTNNYITVTYNDALTSIIDINHFFYKKKITIQYTYVVSKFNIMLILKDYINNLDYTLEDNFDLDLILRILYNIKNNCLNKIFMILYKYLKEIVYIYDEINMYEEIFCPTYNRNLSLTSIINKKQKMIGYGLIVQDTGDHYHFITNGKEKVIGSPIYKNGTKVDNKDNIEFDIINNSIESKLVNFLKKVPIYNIRGIYLYTEINLMIMDYFNSPNLNVIILTKVEDTLKYKINNGIFIIRQNCHISILVKLKNEFISLDSSLKHLTIFKDLICKSNYKLYHFENKLQNSGSCSFYCVKILEIIIKLKPEEIKESFLNGQLLIEIILSLSKFFILENGKQIFSNKIDNLNSWNNQFILKHNNNQYYVDDNFFINKFILFKSVFKNLNKSIPVIFLDGLEKQIQLYIMSLSLRKKELIANNYGIFKQFYPLIEKESALQLINNALNKELLKDKYPDEDKKKRIGEMKKFASRIFSKDNKDPYNDFSMTYSFIEPLKFALMENTAMNILFINFDSIQNFYKIYNSRIRLYVSVGYYFNSYCEKNKLELFSINDEEEDNCFELINI